MSAIEALVRLHRWQLDERRRQLADLDRLAHKLGSEAERLDEERTPAALERRQKITQSLLSVERQIVQAREALAETYQELKRYEVAAANRMMQRRRKPSSSTVEPALDAPPRRRRR